MRWLTGKGERRVLFRSVVRFTSSYHPHGCPTTCMVSVAVLVPPLSRPRSPHKYGFL